MKALVIDELGGPQALRLADVPEPDPRDRVLIQVAVAGVTFPDVLLTRGLYQVRPNPPFSPGLEVAGKVLEAPGGSGFEPGGRVAAFLPYGGYAERVAVPTERTIPIPDGIGVEAAAASVVNFHTALFALRRRARLEAGELLLVLGAAGGLGAAAIQIGAALGARVIAVVRNDEGARIARSAGASELLRGYEGLGERLRELTGGYGADVVFDPVGGEPFAEGLRCLRPDGKLLVLGFAAGQIPQVQLNRLLFRNASVLGAAWGSFVEHDPGLVSEGARTLNDWLERGVIASEVEARYPLQAGADALADLEARRIHGKAVLEVGGPTG